MSPSLAWLGDLLWPEPSGSRVTLRRGGGRPSSEERIWAVMPSASNPTSLIPVGGRPGASALRQFNDSMSQPARIRKAAVGAAVRMGAGRLIARDRFVVTPAGTDAATQDLIGSVLPEILGVPRIEVAISIGRQLRPNLKPVLQIMHPDGTVIAYAKIGWNDLTRKLVRNEGRALRLWGSSPPRCFEVPRLIHEGEWNGSAITVLSPHPHRLLRKGRRNALPSVDILREVASCGGVERMPLAGSAYLARTQERITSLTSGRSAEVLRASLSRTASTESIEEVLFGSSHGDWTPWNMSLSDAGLFVWDWERLEQPTPVGYDVLHFWFEVGFHKEGLDVATASRSALARSHDALERLGVARSSQRSLHRLFLIERSLRIEEGRVAGVPVHEDLSEGLLHELEGGAHVA